MTSLRYSWGRRPVTVSAASTEPGIGGGHSGLMTNAISGYNIVFCDDKYWYLTHNPLSHWGELYTDMCYESRVCHVW